MISTLHRSTAAEIMDDFDFQGEELHAVLKEIDRINRLLGGNKVSINGINHLVKANPKPVYTIVDVGCGSGDLLRSIEKWSRAKNFQVNLIGIDANHHTISIARDASRKMKSLSYREMDVFSEDFSKIQADIITCSLTLHHFSSEKVIALMNQLVKNTEIGVVINDLHRATLAYVLFRIYSFFLMRSKIAIHDGLISILRGFKRKDFHFFAQAINHNQIIHSIQWKWAFRWLWIIQKR